MFRDPALPARFWDKVAPAPSGCWIWLAGRDKDGYGTYRLAGSRSKHWRTHRLTYETLVGPISDGLEVDHLCRVRRCCNPAHAEPVTPRINVDRGINYIAINRQKTHCPSSHPYAGDNLVVKVSSSGVVRRVCRTCRNSAARERMRRLRKAVA